MKDFLKYFTIDKIISAVMCILIGVLFVLIPYSFANVLVIISGILLIAGGIFFLFRFFTGAVGDHTYSLAGAIVLILTGAFTVSHVNMIKGVLNSFFGIIIICIGSIFVARSIEALRQHVRGWMAPLIISGITVALGGVVLFGRFETVFIFTGIVLVIVGIFILILTFIFRDKTRKARNKTSPMDAKWKEV